MDRRQRAVLYARVSSDDSSKDGRNLEGQLDMCRSHAQTKGWRIVAELAEDERGASGASLELPELNRAIEMARAGAFDVLVARELDRLARGLAKQLIIEEELRRHGVRIEYVLGAYADTAEGNLMKNVRAVVAEYERLKIVERSKRGRRLKAKSGKWPCDGHTPYGYRKVGEKGDAHLEIDPDEAEVVRRIFQMYIGPGGKPMSLVAIATALQAEGIHPPRRSVAADKKDACMTWHRNTIRNILRHRRYLGEFSYGGIAIPLPELAIIDEATFKAAAKRHKQARSRSSYRRKYAYLLVGYLQCSCGAHMAGKPMQKGKYLYYKCGAQGNRPHDTECTELMINASDVDGIVWKWLSGLLTNEQKLDQGLRRLMERREDDLAPKKEKLETIKDLIAAAEGRIKRLASALGRADDDAAAHALEGELKIAGRERQALVVQKEAIETELGRQRITQADVDAIKAFAAEIRRKMTGPTIEQKRSLLHMLGTQVELSWRDGIRGVKCTCSLVLEPNGNKTSNGMWMPLERVCGESLSTTIMSRLMTLSLPF